MEPDRHAVRTFRSSEPTTPHVPVRIQCEEGVSPPEYASVGAACFDVRANLPDGGIEIGPGGTRSVPTGFSVALSPLFKLCLVSRSGHSMKGLVVANAPAQIDPDYRGEVKVILRNQTDMPIHVGPGDRVAQGYVDRIYRILWEPGTVDPHETDRGADGFGSTGVR